MIRRLIPASIFAFIFLTLGIAFLASFLGKGRSYLDVQRERFQALRPDKPEYRAFYNNYQSFFRKGKEEQRERLRAIQQRIETDPQSPLLKSQLATYHAWLKTVPQEKAKIDQAKTIEERLDVIRAIKANQDRIHGVTERRMASSAFSSGSTAANNPFPSASELAEFLETLDPEDLQTMLGHTPSNFLYQLEKEYHAQADQQTD